MHARRKVKVYAVLMAVLWAAAIPVNVIVARQNPWSVFFIAGTGAALLIYWLRYGCVFLRGALFLGVSVMRRG